MYDTSVGHIEKVVSDGVHAYPEAQSPRSFVSKSEDIPENESKWKE